MKLRTYGKLKMVCSTFTKNKKLIITAFIIMNIIGWGILG